MPARRLPATAVLPLVLVGLAVAPAAGQASSPPAVRTTPSPVTPGPPPASTPARTAAPSPASTPVRTAAPSPASTPARTAAPPPARTAAQSTPQALAPIQAPPAAGRPPHVLATRADGFLTHLGPVRVGTRTSSLARAYSVFGRPTSARGTGSLRRVRWATAGISIVGLTLGGCRNPDRCRTRELRIQTARVSGPRWQTAAGLKVGDPAARIPALYPEAPPTPADGSGNVVVAHAYSPIGDGGDIPILTARVRDGVVSGFDVWIGDAGD